MSEQNKELVKKETAEMEQGGFNPQADIERAHRAAKALMKVVEATKPLKLNNKTYLYFEHWQTIARFFNVTVGIDKTTKLENGYEAKSIVYQNGVVIGGAEASCTKDEANWRNKPDFQLRSMAQTRAMAKGLRSIFGYIAVLAGIEPTPAEEMPVEAQKLTAKAPKTSKVAKEAVHTLEAPQRSKSKEYEQLDEMIDMAIDMAQLESVGVTIAKLVEENKITDFEVGLLRSKYAVKKGQFND